MAKAALAVLMALQEVLRAADRVDSVALQVADAVEIRADLTVLLPVDLADRVDLVVAVASVDRK